MLYPCIVAIAMVNEIPTDACTHQNETVIHGKNNAYEHTQIKCEDCGSVRMNGRTKFDKDLSHDETV
jgi:hypothetical protein